MRGGGCGSGWRLTQWPRCRPKASSAVIWLREETVRPTGAGCRTQGRAALGRWPAWKGAGRTASPTLILNEQSRPTLPLPLWEKTPANRLRVEGALAARPPFPWAAPSRLPPKHEPPKQPNLPAPGNECASSPPWSWSTAAPPLSSRSAEAISSDTLLEAAARVGFCPPASIPCSFSLQ